MTPNVTLTLNLALVLSLSLTTANSVRKNALTGVEALPPTLTYLDLSENQLVADGIPEGLENQVKDFWVRAYGRGFGLGDRD